MRLSKEQLQDYTGKAYRVVTDTTDFDFWFTKFAEALAFYKIYKDVETDNLSLDRYKLTDGAWDGQEVVTLRYQAKK